MPTRTISSLARIVNCAATVTFALKGGRHAEGNEIEMQVFEPADRVPR